MDGGSSDDTLATAADYTWLRIVEAPATSIYGAINRGIRESCAPAIVLLNADDVLLRGALGAWLSGLQQAPQAGIVRGYAQFAEMRDGALTSPERENRSSTRPMAPDLLLRGPCAINSLCIRRSVFDSIGLFDETLRIASDREWMLRAWLAGIEFSEVLFPVYRYTMHAASTTMDRARRNYAPMKQEHMAIARRYIAKSPSTAGSRLDPVTLRRWHALETALLVAYLVREGSWHEAWHVIARELSVVPRWPLALIPALLSELSRRGT